MTKIIGITGRSGAGKGVACEIFEKYGIPAIDTDAVYHEILSAKGGCTDELATTFGKEILNENGLVERKRLAERVFGKENTPALLHSLNRITHKYIMANTWDIVRVHRAHNARAVLIDAPQLFEAGLEKEVDLTLGIIAPDAPTPFSRMALMRSASTSGFLVTVVLKRTSFVPWGRSASCFFTLSGSSPISLKLNSPVMLTLSSLAVTLFTQPREISSSKSEVVRLTTPLCPSAKRWIRNMVATRTAIQMREGRQAEKPPPARFLLLSPINYLLKRSKAI